MSIGGIGPIGVTLVGHTTVSLFFATQFADGDWIGIELDVAGGKNDGAVKGERVGPC